MRLRIGPSALALAVVLAAGFAMFQRSNAAVPAPDPTPPPAAAAAEPKGATADDPSPELPPNHPPIHSLGAPMVAEHDEAAAITWSAPPGWDTAANTNPIRLATYHQHAAAADGAELVMTRAGGTTEANLERWKSQFAAGGAPTRTERTIDGLHVVILELHGTYASGMGAADTPQTGWAFVGAVIEAGDASYFLKLVGPDRAVRDARPAFESLLASVRKTR